MKKDIQDQLAMSPRSSPKEFAQPNPLFKLNNAKTSHLIAMTSLL